jgi:hypothetical protein
MQLLKNPKIAAVVKEARQSIAEKAIAELALTKEWVLDELIDNVRKDKAFSAPLRDAFWISVWTCTRDLSLVR